MQLSIYTVCVYTCVAIAQHKRLLISISSERPLVTLCDSDQLSSAPATGAMCYVLLTQHLAHEIDTAVFVFIIR